MGEIARPPREYIELVCGSVSNAEDLFDSVGVSLRAFLEGAGVLRENGVFLDVGCGCGRLARRLVDCGLSRYEGFDRHRGMIEWCRENITSLHPEFRFQHVDVVSGYTDIDGDAGSVAVQNFDFPYESDTFDGLVAASVLTHMSQEDGRRYLQEFARVLRPGGLGLVSVFLDREAAHEDQVWNFILDQGRLEEDLEGAGLRYTAFDKPAGEPQSWYLVEAL